MAVIRIKRSTGTSAPGSLKTAEIAYAMGTGTQANSGDRLFFGKGDDGSGNATSIVVVGGEYFTNMLDHVAGVLTASSALIVDASSKLDNLKVDNIDLNGNTISSTDTNGNIVLDPNGTGSVDVSSAKITSLATPTADTDAATKKYVDDQFAGGSIVFTIDADGGTPDAVGGQETVTFVGGTGLTSAVANNQITYTLDNTAVSPGSYGSTTQIPTFTVDQQGRLTAAGTVSVATNLTVNGDGATSDTVSLLDSDITFTGGSGITTTVTNNTVTIAGDDASTSAKGVAQFSSDNFAVSSGLVTIKDGGVANAELVNSSLTVTAGTGLTGGGSVALGSSTTLNVIGGDGITANADEIEVTVDDSTIELSASDGSGAIRVKDAGITNAKLANSSLTVTAGAGLTGGGSVSLGGSTTLNVIGGDGITANADEIEVTVDNSTIELSASDGSGAIRVKDAGITNAKLANSSVTVGTTEISLGSSSTTLAGLTQIDVDNIRILDNTVASTSGVLYIDPNPIDSDGGEVIIRGSLTVQGTTTTVNSTTVSINDLNMVLADSAGNAAAADGAGLTIGGALYSGTKATLTFNGANDEWEMNKTLNMAGSTSLEFAGVDWKEVMEDHLVNNTLVEGEGLDITYDDGANTITFAAELATSSNKGVASFDANEFTVTSGAVALATIDGGTF